jgi:hypothetical protein
VHSQRRAPACGGNNSNRATIAHRLLCRVCEHLDALWQRLLRVLEEYITLFGGHDAAHCSCRLQLGQQLAEFDASYAASHADEHLDACQIVGGLAIRHEARVCTVTRRGRVYLCLRMCRVSCATLIYRPLFHSPLALGVKDPLPQDLHACEQCKK